ncbi:hypothetical protein HAX54_047328 [Datura stramonium]|uniref:Uncharacterized protein n=1 Tax=Datura stramonium TaxID=4076 RepID=A0ABS8WI51_DATST|nr:hypothetical protein [Datura stramonium]
MKRRFSRMNRHTNAREKQKALSKKRESSLYRRKFTNRWWKPTNHRSTTTCKTVNWENVEVDHNMGVSGVNHEIEDETQVQVQGFRSLPSPRVSPALCKLRPEKHWCSTGRESLCPVTCPGRQLSCESRVYTYILQL